MIQPLLFAEREGGPLLEGEPKGLPPLLKWAGGKRWLVPQLALVYEPHRSRRFVELFAGGLALALAFRPKRALLNDVNPHLINFYRWVQRGLKITLPMVYQRELYYAYRERFNELIRRGLWESEEAAQLFYYLNRTGYNGLCRFNRKGEFNVPFGKYKSVNYRTDFSLYQEAFREWVFVNADFRNVPLAPEDFVYADPPYDVEFTEYSPGGFSWQDQMDLAELLANHPGPVVISNQATSRIIELYKKLGYELHFVPAPRRISCDGNRQSALEVLALRNL